MKKFLITTVLGIATTAAFGAASLRAPQMGGTATVATPTATNTARAGTLRTQTMKTSSVSTPTSVTTTQSIATPVSTETTDARIALLKGIKGFNPGKIKDTTAATNELNAIDSRIEELQTQLDRAEAAQSSVITEANIDAKIDQKLSALGTSSGTKETYSKAEVDNLLNDIKRKLPQIDDRGNINMTDPNGNLVSSSIWQNIGSGSGPVSQSLNYFVTLPNNQQSVEKIINFARSKCNNWNVEPRESFACGAIGITRTNDYNGQGGYLFEIANHFKGWEESHGNPEIIHQNGQVIYRSGIETYEYNNLAALKTAVCGETTSDWCDVGGFTAIIDDGLGMRYAATMERRLREGLSDNERPTIDDRGNINMTDPNGGLISWSPFEYLHTQNGIALNWMDYLAMLPNTEQSVEKIRNWARSKCTTLTTTAPDTIFDCALHYMNYQNLFNGYNGFNGSSAWFISIAVYLKGYAEYQDPEIITTYDGHFIFRKYLQSFEYDTEEKFRTAACGNRSADECSITAFVTFPVAGAHNAYRATVDYIYNAKGETDGEEEQEQEATEE